MSQADRDDAREHDDAFLVLFAFGSLAGSIALFAQAKHNLLVRSSLATSLPKPAATASTSA
jgi:hypothetical protein